jgi:hypothetical protein
LAATIKAHRRHQAFSLLVPSVVFVLTIVSSHYARPAVAATEEEMEQLYRTAALWEVGTNRDRVRDAREKLIAIGADAVKFIVEKHLGYTESLEMRAVEEVLRAHKDLAGPLLVEALKTETEENYRLRNTFYMCGSIEYDGCVPALLTWLLRASAAPAVQTPTPENRQPTGALSGRALRALIGALGALKPRSAVPALGPFLDYSDDMVVVATANTLKSIGDVSAVPLLLKRLESGNLVRRTVGEDAVTGFGEAARKEVFARLKTAEQNPRVLAHYLSIIARVNIKGDYGRVHRYLKHADDTVRGYAVRAAIVTGGRRAIDDLRGLRKGETSPFVLGEIDRALAPQTS